MQVNKRNTKYFLLLFFSIIFLLGHSQTIDSSKIVELKTFTVTTYNEQNFKESSLNIIPLRIESLNNFGNFNLTDLLSKTPGVSMLSTGVAISKPVIRGLYGNRTIVLLSGLKFDNQQWQEEHGLGLSDLGLSKVELIKGPLGILYGSEAIGGIINLIEEEKPEINTSARDFGIRVNSNTLGGLTQFGYKVNHGKRWFRLRLGIENNADYSDGNNHRVLNSRLDGYNLKTTYGISGKNWVSTNNFLSSFNRFGFIFNDIYSFVSNDYRWSRRLNVNPTHLVLLNIFSSENKFTLKNNSILNFTFGIQSNKRMENEGGGAISLNMHLLTFQYLLKWERQLKNTSKLILSNLSVVENNSNYGSRKIVPDANMLENNLSAYIEKSVQNKIFFENGIGIGQKTIATKTTPSINTIEKEIKPFNKFSPYYNFFSGLSFIPNNSFNFKVNLSTGVRIANLAELSSDGLHEGVFTYEIGNPKLKNEELISLNFLANFDSKYFSTTISPFYNYFSNYIYLSPTKEDWYGFPIYRYLQQDAKQYGTEANVNGKINSKINLGIAYSGMISKTADGSYTPFIPAQKVNSTIHSILLKNSNSKLHLFSNYEYYFAQNKISKNEISTPSYGIWNAGISYNTKKKGNSYTISISGNNLLNKKYYDHLSRLKYFGILNIGRNIALNLKVNF